MGILDNAREVAKAVQEIHNLELYQRVLNLHSDIISLVEENNELREQIQALKKQAEIKGKLSFRDGNYYLRSENGTEDGPFCQVCQDIESRLVRMQVWSSQGPKTLYFCDYCSNRRPKR